MSTSDVTREGIQGARPGREAMGANQTSPTEDAAALRIERHEPRRKGGERALVPKAEFRSYYGRPVLKPPTWKALDIAGYLFLGGLAGASSTIAAGAEATGRAGLAKHSKIGALAAISLGTVGLVHDLGRPSRFANMLRVLKPTSPMSVGSWLLSLYAPAAGIAATTSLLGRFTKLGRAATWGAGLLGPAVASYTAVLISDTAAPAWHDGRNEMPFVFVGSAAAAAGGFGLLTAPAHEAGPAARAALLGAGVETASLQLMKQRMGLASETYEQGRAGTLLKAAEALTAGGALATVLGRVGRRPRAASMIGGAALMTASALTRFGIFEAGRASAEDPKYTVVPQRARLTEQGSSSAR